MLRSITLIGALVAAHSALAASGYTCSDPRILESVKEEVTCSELVRCSMFGGYQKILTITPQEYMAGVGMKHGPTEDIGRAILRNGYAQFYRIGEVITSIDSVPMTYDQTVGRLECRARIHWNLPVLRVVLFSGIYTDFIAHQPGGMTITLLGKDAGWAWMKNQLGFDSKVYDQITIEYAVLDNGKIDLEQIGELWANPANR